MTDLVERLRGDAELLKQHACEFFTASATEAADAIERLTARCAELERANFALASGQCCVPYGLWGDEHGNQYCALQERCAEHEQFRHQHRDCDAMGVENQTLRARCAELEEKERRLLTDPVLKTRMGLESSLVAAEHLLARMANDGSPKFSHTAKELARQYFREDQGAIEAALAAKGEP